ncbi:MAG: hypothetical protein ABJE95_15365 [Byssovorax sp.]
MHLLRALVLAAALTLASTAAADPLTTLAPAIATDVQAGRPLVLYVVVPLCSNEQINCGSAIAGRAAGLEHNVYWGASFGARHFFDRPGSGWEQVEVSRRGQVFLERIVYRRRVPGAPWGREAPVEQLVVIQAIHGDAIDTAVDHLYATATSGGQVSFMDGKTQRNERVQIVGYAGHNRMMDGKTLPDPAPGARSPIPSFVLACKSEPYFSPQLTSAGSTPLVMTATLMAPEAYLIDAIARGIGDNAPPAELRSRAVAAYAKWQNLTPRQASSVFALRR